MKKILFITFVSFLWSNISKANEIHLVCVNTNDKNFAASLSIYETDKKISFNGGAPDFYFLENGIFKYVMASADKKFKFRHSLNRNTGMLQVNTYELTDEQNGKHVENSVKNILENDKMDDRNYWAKIAHEDLGSNYKSSFDGYFTCDTAKSKF
jgi:hypothetical protein